MKEVAQELSKIVAQVQPMLLGLTEEPIAERDRGPDKWSRKEILGHLIDSACNNQQKFVRMQQSAELEFPGYQQDEWVALQNWNAATWQVMVDLWAAYNRHLAFLMASVPESRHQHKIKIDGVGPFELGFVMPDYVEHLKHHLLQIFPDLDLSADFKNVYKA